MRWVACISFRQSWVYSRRVYCTLFCFFAFRFLCCFTLLFFSLFWLPLSNSFLLFIFIGSFVCSYADNERLKILSVSHWCVCARAFTCRFIVCPFSAIIAWQLCSCALVFISGVLRFVYGFASLKLFLGSNASLTLYLDIIYEYGVRANFESSNIIHSHAVCQLDACDVRMHA